MKVHLVDGTYELFRAFYGGPPSVGADGTENGAVRTLVRSLLALLRDPEVTHIGCAFDHVIESFRNTLFDGYKTGDGIEPSLFSQFELAENACRALGIATWPMIEFEADDALATMAARAAADGRVTQVVVCTPDKDLAQCVQGRRVICLDRMRKKELDESGVVDKFGVGPRSIPDFLALVGDSADGIPGIAGFGAKSAGALLAVYGKLEAIPARADDWTPRIRGAARLGAALESGRADALLYRTLATLRDDVPLTENVDDLEWRVPPGEKLSELARLLDDPGVVERAMDTVRARG